MGYNVCLIENFDLLFNWIRCRFYKMKPHLHLEQATMSMTDTMTVYDY